MEGLNEQLASEILAAKNETFDEESNMEEEENWSDWEEDEDQGSDLYQSLFEEKQFKSPEECFDYDAKEYGFDIRQWNKRLNLGFYGCIKLVNYIRSRRVDRDSADEILSVFNNLGESHPWDDDQFLIPVSSEDNLLTSLEFDEE
jgi:type I protein arginine methyltransferase